jgi:hypothetical protein
LAQRSTTQPAEGEELRRGGPAEGAADYASNANGRTRAERRAAQHNAKYKTELCKNWVERGSCPYGAKCQFAHGTDEMRLRDLKPTYKSRPCQAFLSTGHCPYGTRCKYFHGDDDEERLLSLHEELLQRRSGQSSTGPAGGGRGAPLLCLSLLSG